MNTQTLVTRLCAVGRALIAYILSFYAFFIVGIIIIAIKAADNPNVSFEDAALIFSEIILWISFLLAGFPAFYIYKKEHRLISLFFKGEAIEKKRNEGVTHV